MDRPLADLPDLATPRDDIDDTLVRAIDAGRFDPSQAADPLLAAAQVDPPADRAGSIVAQAAARRVGRQGERLDGVGQIVNKSLVKWLKDLADEIRQVKGVEVALELFAKRPQRIVAAEPPQPYTNIERLRSRRPKRR